MHSDLKTLLELQAIDREIDAFNDELKSIPVTIEGKRTEIKAQTDALESDKARITNLQLKKKEKEIEVATYEESARKNEMQLNTLKSNESYKAMLGEIEKSKQLKSQVEDDILNIMIESENAAKELKVLEAELKAKQQKLEGEIKAEEAKAEQIKQKAAEGMQKREAFVSQVRNDLLTRYEYIRKKKKGTIIVPIAGESCTGCNTILTQSSINEVRKGKELVTCDSCSSILFFPEPQSQAASA